MIDVTDKYTHNCLCKNCGHPNVLFIKKGVPITEAKQHKACRNCGVPLLQAQPHKRIERIV